MNGGQQDSLFGDDVPGVDLARLNADAFWWASGMRAVSALAATLRPFQAYDISELGVPEPDNPNRWGALLRTAYTAGVIKPVGYVQSRRPGRAGGATHLWIGTTP